ncbi:metal-dependent hydrolase [Erythrobacter crassostreae]|uniref:Metal-dependent hydrolase n=1 Tax=Erythrobacter crassostreae TaxID=2828328 RepID=A0A9X1F3V2_9SPHN|nr:metal-dependent hydrolase [Erythrobacter crassostrea]MBV7258828.1 metal-dependent hydrolase [Erythrobacter crassostrea]
MPTIFTHAIVPLAIAAAAGRGVVSPKVAIAGAIFAIAPDADVAGFKLGVEYADAWGHRGATHSLAFAAICAGVLSLVWREARSLGAFVFLTMAMASHGLLDTLTSGGLGAALWWPFDDARIFAPITPVRVSPIGMGFFSARGLDTLLSEIKWIWLPCSSIAFAGWGLRRAKGAVQKG